MYSAHVQCTCARKANESKISFERISDAVRNSKAFEVLFERVSDVEPTRSTSRSNAFGFSFEHVRFSSNAFGLSFKRVSYDDRTQPGCRSNAFIRGANALRQKRVIPCV